MAEDMEEAFSEQAATEALDEWGNPALIDVLVPEGELETEEEEDSGFFDPESLIS